MVNRLQTNTYFYLVVVFIKIKVYKICQSLSSNSNKVYMSLKNDMTTKTLNIILYKEFSKTKHF